MKNEFDIENKISATLDSIEAVERATPLPFFYSKVLAKLSREKQSSWGKFVSYINQPAVAFATICIILVINIAAIFYNASFINPAASETNELAVADEYNDITTTFFDMENPKP